jgi:hypothetical protein
MRNWVLKEIKSRKEEEEEENGCFIFFSLNVVYF